VKQNSGVQYESRPTGVLLRGMEILLKEDARVTGR